MLRLTLRYPGCDCLRSSPYKSTMATIQSGNDENRKQCHCKSTGYAIMSPIFAQPGQNCLKKGLLAGWYMVCSLLSVEQKLYNSNKHYYDTRKS